MRQASAIPRDALTNPDRWKLSLGHGKPRPEVAHASSFTLGNQFESLVRQRVKASRFSLRSEILQESVRAEREMRLAALDASIMRGIADADAGRVHDLDTVVARWLRNRTQ